MTKQQQTERVIGHLSRAIDNQRELGAGHHHGKPCLLLTDGAVVLLGRYMKRNPRAAEVQEQLRDLVGAFGVEGIEGAGYIYWYDMPKHLREADLAEEEASAK